MMITFLASHSFYCIIYVLLLSSQLMENLPIHLYLLYFEISIVILMSLLHKFLRKTLENVCGCREQFTRVHLVIVVFAFFAAVTLKFTSRSLTTISLKCHAKLLGFHFQLTFPTLVSAAYFTPDKFHVQFVWSEELIKREFMMLLVFYLQTFHKALWG